MRKTLCIAIVAAVATSASAGPTFHGDIARTGVYAGSAPLRSPVVRWSFATQGPIVASPAVEGGVVYVASLSGFLFAVDQATGKEKWRFKSRLPIASSPTVAGGSVFFVSSTGALAALDAATGSPQWVFATESERKFEAKGLHGYPSTAQTIPDAWDLFTSSPAVADGVVYFGSGDGGVYAVEAKTGLLRWKFRTGDVVHASPAVVAGTVYVGSWDGRFYAIDAQSGLQRWMFQAGTDPAVHNQVGFQSSAAVVDGVVYVGCRDAHVYAFDAASGRLIWDYSTSKSWVNGTPAVQGGMVYVGTSDTARFMALDAKSGRLRFNFDARAYVFSSAALAGGLAIFGTHNGHVYAVDAQRGELAWAFATESAKRNADRLLTPEGRLDREAFKPVFGDFQDMYVDFARFVSLGAVFASPVVDRGVVYVASSDGNLYALE